MAGKKKVHHRVGKKRAAKKSHSKVRLEPTLKHMSMHKKGGRKRGRSKKA